VILAAALAAQLLQAALRFLLAQALLRMGLETGHDLFDRLGVRFLVLHADLRRRDRQTMTARDGQGNLSLRMPSITKTRAAHGIGKAAITIPNGCRRAARVL